VGALANRLAALALARGNRLAARQLAAQRRVTAAHCAHCGAPMLAIAHRIYCSQACRQRAYYRRKRARARG
jgi:hypothetical protein